MKNRIHSFVWGGIAALAFLLIGIFTYVSSRELSDLIAYGVLGLLSFTFISCLILNNNFLGDMILEIFSWGFVKMPGLIFELDLDGILWLLTVKLAFWILGIILAVICGILAIVVGLLVSVFVYPFAIYKNFKEPTL